ncbi:unnamed protein product [Lathyrus oleraceus]
MTAETRFPRRVWWWSDSKCVSSLAWFMSNKETSFVIIGQGLLENPLRTYCDGQLRSKKRSKDFYIQNYHDKGTHQ